MKHSPTLYLIPTFLSEESMDVLPAQHLEIVKQLDEFIVENPKTARQFLKRVGTVKPLQELIMHSLNEHTPESEVQDLLKPLKAGKSIGLLSEAGCPAVADPGSEVVRMAHEANIKVQPLIGPSSILLALMASGLNGQSFVFHGYLPRETAVRKRKIKELEKEAIRKKQTQIFIETPYRNQALIQDVLGTCEDDSLFCIASLLTSPREKIVTRTIANWKKRVPELGKIPAIFLIGN